MYSQLPQLSKNKSTLLRKFIPRIFLLGSALFALGLPLHTYAAHHTYDMGDATNYNIRFDGAGAGDYFSHVAIQIADFDHDHKPDVAIESLNSDNNSRSNSGSVYIIFNSLLSTFTNGSSIDLADTNNWNIRFDGAVTTGTLGNGMAIADVNGDTSPDLIMAEPFADQHARTNSGSVYVIYSTIFDELSGTGNILDINNPANWNFRFDGVTAQDNLGDGIISTADFDNDGVQDIAFSARDNDYNGRLNSGSAYIISHALLEQYSGTGNTFDLTDATSYTLRIDGAVADDNLSHGAIEVADFNDDSSPELLLGAFRAENNGYTDSGSVYLLDNALLAGYGSTTGNTLDLANSANWNIRFDGPRSTGGIGSFMSLFSITTANISSATDILFGALGSDNNGIESGSIYYISNGLITQYESTTGNTLDLANSANWNIRFDGENASDLFGYLVNGMKADIDSDGIDDIFTTSRLTDQNGRVDSGSFYVIPGGFAQSFPGTGNIVDMSTISVGQRYDGAGAGDWLSYLKSNLISDLNGDGSPDLLIGSNTADNNGRIDSGSLYVIYNFPHTFTAGATLGSITTGNTYTFTGSIIAPDSTTDIAAVQYQLDSNAPTGDWHSCIPDDGLFDGITSEGWTCALSGLSSGTHTISIRAQDSNEFFSAPSHYLSKSFIIDSNAAISSVSANRAHTTMMVNWTTDAPGSSIVEYWNARNGPTLTTAESDISPRVINHLINLTGLEECATYRYRITSEDSAGNRVTSATHTAPGPCDTGKGGSSRGAKSKVLKTPQKPVSAKISPELKTKQGRVLPQDFSQALTATPKLINAWENLHLTCQRNYLDLVLKAINPNVRSLRIQAIVKTLEKFSTPAQAQRICRKI